MKSTFAKTDGEEYWSTANSNGAQYNGIEKEPGSTSMYGEKKESAPFNLSQARASARASVGELRRRPSEDTIRGSGPSDTRPTDTDIIMDVGTDMRTSPGSAW